jgi:hypothetical protein
MTASQRSAEMVRHAAKRKKAPASRADGEDEQVKRDRAYYKNLLLKQASFLEGHARADYLDKSRGPTDEERRGFLLTAQGIREAIGEHRCLETFKALSGLVANSLQFLNFQKLGIDPVKEARKSHAGRVAVYEFEKSMLAAAEASPGSELAECMKNFRVSKDPDANVLAFPTAKLQKRGTLRAAKRKKQRA